MKFERSAIDPETAALYTSELILLSTKQRIDPTLYPIRSPVLGWHPDTSRFFLRVQRSNKNTRNRGLRTVYSSWGWWEGCGIVTSDLGRILRSSTRGSIPVVLLFTHPKRQKEGVHSTSSNSHIQNLYIYRAAKVFILIRHERY